MAAGTQRNVYVLRRFAARLRSIRISARVGHASNATEPQRLVTRFANRSFDRHIDSERRVTVSSRRNRLAYGYFRFVSEPLNRSYDKKLAQFSAIGISRPSRTDEVENIGCCKVKRIGR